jgi:DNA-binding HxlR family transcriptional regulator
MQRKSFGDMPCPIARSLERVGEWWSILILRDALHGYTRFDQFRKSLGIAPNMLTRRLNALVEAELLERRRYSEHPPRDEYVLTTRGRDFGPVIVALLAWGNKHFAPEGASVLLLDAQTGVAADPIMVDRATGRPLEAPGFVYSAGPAAGARTRAKFAAIDRERAGRNPGRSRRRAVAPTASGARNEHRGDARNHDSRSAPDDRP